MRAISRWAKELEEKVEMMDADYKSRIAELESKEPVMPLEQHEVKIKEIKST